MGRATLASLRGSFFGTPESSRYALGMVASALLFLVSAVASIVVLLFSDLQGWKAWVNLLVPAMALYFLVDAFINGRKALAHSPQR